MQDHDFLPLGTVVKLEFNDCKIIITGYRMKGSSGYVFDYCGCRYPEGLISKEYIYYFNRENICEIVELGYIDDEVKEILKKVHNNKFKKKKEIQNE